MEIESLSSGAVNLERTVCFIRETLLVETALVAEKCLCWLLLAIGSLPNDLFPEVCPNNERFLFPLVNRGWEPDAEKDDASKTENDADHKKCDYDEQNDGDVLGEDGSDYGDEDDEDADYDDYNGDNGSNDGDEDDDDNDDDDGSWDDDSNEEDKEEYDEDDEEEKTSGPSKKHKSVATSSDDTTGSEYDDDTDDEPGHGSLLKHAREVYNLTSFRIFQSEYKKSRALNVDVSNETFDRRGFIFEYKLRKFGHHFREHTVTAIPFDDIIDCSCKYFDYVGVLCCHALLVLGCLRIEKIPDRYLLKWRTKTGLGDTVEEPCSLIKNNNKHRSSSPGSIHHSWLKETGKLNTEVSEDVLDTRTDHGDAPLLRHARDIYMPNIFLMFQEEYKESEYLFVCAVHETLDHGKIVFDCEVRKPRHSRYRKVHAEPDDGRVNCSCKGFEKTGILCSHALSVLDCLCIERIPAPYILEKFKKNPGVAVVEDIHGEGYSELAHFIRFKILHSRLDELAKKASMSDEAQNIFLKHIDTLHIMLGDTSSEETGSETDEDSVIACEMESVNDINNLGSTNATENKGLKKAIGLNHDQTSMNCNEEELKAKSGQSTTTDGTSLHSSSPSACRTSQCVDSEKKNCFERLVQPKDEFSESAHLNMQAFDQNKNY